MCKRIATGEKQKDCFGGHQKGQKGHTGHKTTISPKMTITVKLDVYFKKYNFKAFTEILYIVS